MARLQDLNLLHALKYERVLRAGLQASSLQPQEVDEVLLETYARILATGPFGVVDERSVGKLTVRTASIAAGRELTVTGTSVRCPLAKVDPAVVAQIVCCLPPRSREVLLMRKGL